jgi:hypothetical protein
MKTDIYFFDKKLKGFLRRLNSEGLLLAQWQDDTQDKEEGCDSIVRTKSFAGRF